MPVGYQSAELVLGARKSPLHIFYPTDTAETMERFGPYSLEVARDGVVRTGAFPLIVISHGRGGTPWVYRTLAHHLAANGFIVVGPEHPGDSRSDNSLEDTLENLELRPRTVEAAINWMRRSAVFVPSLKRDSISLIGHSLGSYTVLAVAGGKPTSQPHQAPDGKAHPIAVTHEHRINAVVLLAPATVWLREPGAMQGITCPILAMAGEKDEITPARYHVEGVLNGVPDPSKVTYREIANGGHFSFLSPFPDFMRNANFPPAQDPEGFDRNAFLARMNAEILEFLNQHA